MYLMTHKGFSSLQIAALFFLFVGTVCTQLEEVFLAALLGSKGMVAICCALTVLSIPQETKQTSNSQWECNVQLTVSMLFRAILLTVFSPVGGFDVFLRAAILHQQCF